MGSMRTRRAAGSGLGSPFPRRVTAGWAVIVGVLLVAGAYFMFDRLANGLGMAGATNAVPWGLWVVVYIWFSGWRAACTCCRRSCTC
ncbi:MAG: hypothetical protein V8S24_12880 [Gordonibacter pamelaeae]